MEKFHCWYIDPKPNYIKLFMSLTPSGAFSIWRVKTIFITFIIITGLSTSALGQIKAAKTEMAQYNYAKAIEILHQFIQKADPKTKMEATLLMADCYRLQNDMQDARSWYFKAIRMGNNDPLTYFYYGKALRACGEYEAAKKIFLHYDSLMPDDHRGKIYASFCDSAIAWDEKPFAFEVNNARNLNSASSEFGPVFYNEGVVFATDKVMTTEDEKKSGWAGHGYLKLVFADPKQKDDFYGDYNLPRLIPDLYTNGSNDGPATFSKDGNEVFITRTTKTTDKTKDASEEGQSNQLKIYSATKTGDKWSKLKPFFFNSSHYSVGYPALSPDGNSLYFVSDVEGGFGGLDLYVAIRDGANWSTPTNLGPIVNTFGDETFPFMADNGDLYFASDGHPGYGGLDIFVTRKVGNVWLNPQNLGRPINSSYDDFALAMYKNDSVGLFSANRPGGRGEDDIYTFRVVGPLPALTSQPAIAALQNPAPQKEGKPPVTEEQKLAPPLAENVVPVPAPVTAEQKVTTPPTENVVPVPAPVTAEVKPPEQKQEVVTPPEEIQQPNPKSVAQTENPAPRLVVTGCVKDGTTHDPIPTATVFFLNENNGQVFVHKSNATGCFRSELLTGINYRIKAMQTGYSSDCVPFFSNTSGDQTEIGISNDLLLEKTDVFHTYKVDNIYYDFDRYFIRPDAEPSLNKLVQIMNDNPVTVELGAHADCRGSDAYNMVLTEKRAASAAHYIIQKGISVTRIVSHWYGKSRLTNNCDCTEGIHCTEAQHQANRRCEFKISVPSLAITESSINLEKYHDGDTLDTRLLPPDFFKNCNHRILSGPLAELLESSTLISTEQNSNVLYTVQIGAFSYLKPHFNGLNEVMSCKGSDGILRCFVGKFSSKEEANWFRDHLRSGEFKDAFVAVMDEKHNPNEVPVISQGSVSMFQPGNPRTSLQSQY